MPTSSTSTRRSKLAIEVDGGSHFTAAAIRYDQKRTAHLHSFRIAGLRFTNLDIAENIEGVLDTIAAAVASLSSTGP